MKLQVENMNFSYPMNKVIEDISLHIEEGEFVGLIGPNGSGKSTVLRNLYRALHPDSGAVYLDGKNLYQMDMKKAARKIGVVGQENEVPFDFKVDEIVAMGRSPYKNLFDGDTKEDKEMIAIALKQIGMEDKAKKSYSHLSGGEKQRVLLARVLTQQTELLLLDEPTNHLDIHHQLQLFDLIKGLNVTVLSAVHDLNIAALYCNRIYVLKEGRIYKVGAPEEILTAELISEVYNVKADVSIHPVTKKVSITYLPESLMR